MPFTDDPIDLTQATLIQSGATDFAVANDGTLVFALPALSKSSLVWVDRAGALSPVAGSPVEMTRPDLALSPDGRRAAFIVGSGADANVVVRDLESGVDTRLTFNKATDTGGSWSTTLAPAWFPAGDRILHMTGAIDAHRLVTRRADVAGEAREMTEGRLGAISTDGRTLVFLLDDRGRGRLRRAPLLPDGRIGTPEPVFRGENEPDVGHISLSPDGRLLAYVARQPDSRTNVFLTGFPTGNGQWLVAEGGSRPRFSSDGRELFYVKGDVDERGQPTARLMSAAITVDPAVTIGAAAPVFAATSTDGPRPDGDDVAPDGRRFLMSKPLAPAPGEGTRRVLVQNWRAAMKK